MPSLTCKRLQVNKPVVTKSKKSIAGFKSAITTLWVACDVVGAHMYEFLDRLVTVAMPRIRDFRGVSGKSFDGRGNYNMGVRNKIIFPESSMTRSMRCVGEHYDHHHRQE